MAPFVVISRKSSGEASSISNLLMLLLLRYSFCTVSSLIQYKMLLVLTYAFKFLGPANRTCVAMFQPRWFNGSSRIWTSTGKGAGGAES